MKKFSKFLNNIMLGLFSAWGVLFILKIIGFSLGIDLGIFLRVIMGFLSLGLIVNFRKIKEILSSKDFRKKFFLLTGFNIFVFALFLLFYPIFLFGSPFVFEDQIPNFKVKEKIPLEINKPIIQEFLAKSNRLGTIGIKILVEEKNREGEFEEELTGAVDKFVFRIKEKGARNYFYENIYEFNEYFQSGFYPFGFPLQENSKNKEYIFEIEKIEENSQRRFLVEINKDGNLNFYPRYVYNLASFKYNWKPIWENINRKTLKFLQIKNNQFNIFSAFILIEFLIFIFGKKNDFLFTERVNFYLKGAFFISLFLISILSLNYKFIQKIDFLQIIINKLYYYNFFLIFLTVILSILIFYLNKETLEKIFKEEEFRERNKEKRRLKKFSSNLNRIEKIPIIGIIIKNIYREGLTYILLLVLIFLLAFLLRFINLTILDPYTDEYIHLVAAKDWLEKGNFGYNRAIIVTFLVKKFFILGKAKSFLEYLYWGRIPSVIFGSLTVIPLYILGKKISKKNGIIASFLWAISPWAVGINKTIREYTYYIFLISIFIILTIEAFLELKNRRKLKFFLLSSFIFLFLIYSYFIDNSSTIKIFVLYFILTVLFFVFFDFIVKNLIISSSKKSFLLVLFLLLGIPILITSVKENFLITPFLNLKIRGDFSWFNYFFNSKTKFPLHWWGNCNFEYVVYFLFFLSILFSIFFYKKTKFSIFYLYLYFSVLIFFIFFFNRYSRPRYISYNLIFFCLIISSSTFFLLLILRLYKNKLIATLIFVFFLVSIFNIENIIYPILSAEHGYVITTGEYHDRVREIINFLKTEISGDDVFIGTIFNSVLELEFNINKDRLYYYSFSDPKRFDFVKKIVEENNQGLMILDSRRNGRWSSGYPKEGSFMIGKKIVNTILNKNGIQVYRWRNSNY